jgi:hypothetical protein
VAPTLVALAWDHPPGARLTLDARVPRLAAAHLPYDLAITLTAGAPPSAGPLPALLVPAAWLPGGRASSGSGSHAAG